jgi:hypothetical protein
VEIDKKHIVGRCSKINITVTYKGAGGGYGNVIGCQASSLECNFFGGIPTSRDEISGFIFIGSS